MRGRGRLLHAPAERGKTPAWCPAPQKWYMVLNKRSSAIQQLMEDSWDQMEPALTAVTLDTLLFHWALLCTFSTWISYSYPFLQASRLDSTVLFSTRANCDTLNTDCTQSVSVSNKTITSCKINQNHGCVSCIFTVSFIFVHMTLKHSYLLSGEDEPICTKCDTVLTVKHIFLDCPELRDVRLKYFTACSLKDIFESVDNQSIIGFIKDANFYYQL